MRNSLEIQENMLAERKRKLEVRGGRSEIELIDFANDPRNYRKSRKNERRS